MKHGVGLMCDNSSLVEQHDASRINLKAEASTQQLKGLSTVSAASNAFCADLYNAPYSCFSHTLNSLFRKALDQAVAFSDREQIALACNGVGCGSFPTSGDIDPQSLRQTLLPWPATLTPFPSVRALSSTSHNGMDKSLVTPIGKGDEAAGSGTTFTNFHQINPAEGLTVKSLPRSSMPLITPTHREGEFICGWGAAFINICVTFPINKAIFRQQLHGISGRRAIRQLRKDGLHYLYRGLLPPLLQKTMSLSVMFGMYFHCQDVLKENFPNLATVPNHAISAMMAGTLEASFMPFERIQTLMQHREFHNRFANTPEAFRHLWSFGLKEYYRGLSLIIWRNGPSNVAFFLGREYFQTITPQPDSQTKKMLMDFISGACLGAMISTAFFPLNVVKTRMQSKLGGPHESGWDTLKVLLAERQGRFSELFKGVHLNYTRSFISWGIINASFEVLIKLYNCESWKKAS